MSKNNKTVENPAENNTKAAFDVNWDIEKYKDEHECEEHWLLRKAFLEKWKSNFPEERLICLARVYTNIQFMGCRYPPQVMEQMAQLSFDVGQKYKEKMKTKLQRTFVSASAAAEDRARGVKRIGGKIVTDRPKAAKIAFIPQGAVPDPQTDEKNASDEEGNKNASSDDNMEMESTAKAVNQDTSSFEKKTSERIDVDYYIKEMSSIKCLDVRLFKENMLMSSYGRLVLLIRPWATKLWNIQTSCQVCHLNITSGYENRVFSLCINQKLLAQATGESKVEARSAAENIAWEKLSRQVVCVLVKEQFIPQGDARISVSDVSGKNKNDAFGTPVENAVAMKMMKMMGWQGGGLGADAQGIAEPIKPNLQMVNRAGLGSQGVGPLRRAVQDLMQRYIASDTLDVDLVFTNDFTKPERAILHHIAQKSGLASRSYGEGDERFLVVKKKLNPFALVRAIVEKGGTTPKYQVYIPETLARNTSQ